MSSSIQTTSSQASVAPGYNLGKLIYHCLRFSRRVVGKCAASYRSQHKPEFTPYNSQAKIRLTAAGLITPKPPQGGCWGVGK